MRTETITIYTFGELPSERAKEKAREWWRHSDSDYPWRDDAITSINHFCAHFGVKLTDYEVSTHRPYSFKTDADNHHFRGRKLKDFNANHAPTGYCLDYTLWHTFYKEFERSGSARGAFSDALHAAFKDIVSDMEWQDSDECVDETLVINEYEFTADGARY